MNIKKVVGNYYGAKRVRLAGITASKPKRYHVLQALIEEKKLRCIAEIGTAKGATAEYLLENCPKLKLVCVDPYTVHAEYYDDPFSAEEVIAKHLAVARKRVFNRYSKRVTFLRTFSVYAASLFKDNHFDMVFIDGNHRYEPALEDLNAWYDKVRPGGVVAGHDYSSAPRRAGVIKAVTEFFTAKSMMKKLIVSADSTWIMEK